MFALLSPPFPPNYLLDPEGQHSSDLNYQSHDRAYLKTMLCDGHIPCLVTKGCGHGEEWTFLCSSLPHCSSQVTVAPTDVELLIFIPAFCANGHVSV